MKCRAANPLEAMFCQNCGAELPDEHGNVELTVRSGVVCEKISTSNGTQTFTSTNVCTLKVPGDKPTVIVLQYKGNLFNKIVNPQSNSTLHVSWGKVSLQCHNVCQITIKGPHIKVPLHFIGKQNINLPYGNYQATFELDGKSETKEIKVDTEYQSVVSGLERFFTLKLCSDAPIRKIYIKSFNKKENKIQHYGDVTIKEENGATDGELDNLKEGSYIVNFKVEQIYEGHKIEGQHAIPIDLNENKEIKVKWCRFTLKSNATSKEVVYKSPHFTTTYYPQGPTLLLCTGHEYTLALTKPHGQKHTETIKVADSKPITLERYWKNIRLKFDRNSYNNYHCRYAWDTTKKQDIPESKEVVLEDVMYGEHNLSYYIDSGKHATAENRISVTASSNDVIHCRINTSYTYKWKWMWLRRLVLFIVYLVNTLLYSSVFAFLSLLTYMEIQRNGVDEGWILGLLAILSGIPLYLLFNRNDDDHFYLSYKIPFWGLSGFCLATTSISFIWKLFDKNFSKACRFVEELYNEYGGDYWLGALAIYGFAWLFSNYVITRSIKCYTIEETLTL